MTNAPDRCSLRILLVDDEPDLYLASAEVLRDAGHEVHTARDGEQALQLMTSLTVDVVLTDIRLPKLDGLSLFRQVRDRWPTTIVILVTAFAEVHEAIAAVREGAHDYLTEAARQRRHRAAHRADRGPGVDSAPAVQGAPGAGASGRVRTDRRPLGHHVSDDGPPQHDRGERRVGPARWARPAPARSWSPARSTIAARATASPSSR